MIQQENIKRHETLQAQIIKTPENANINKKKSNSPKIFEPLRKMDIDLH